jgi:hypothetical protein
MPLKNTRIGARWTSLHTDPGYGVQMESTPMTVSFVNPIIVDLQSDEP